MRRSAGAPTDDADTAINGSFKPITTPKRRAHFSNAARRQAFVYDPDVVYGTSFYTPFADLNTFSLKMGSMMPQIDLLPRLGGMPIRSVDARVDVADSQLHPALDAPRRTQAGVVRRS